MADQKPLHWVRASDIAERYANNFTFESSAWDLKLMCATLDQGMPDPSVYAPTIKCHTVIQMPWKQAKLLAYAVCMNVLWHEKAEGKIQLTQSPPTVDALAKDLADTPGGPELIRLDKILRSVLFDEQAP